MQTFFGFGGMGNIVVNTKATNKALHRIWYTWHLFRGASLAKKLPSAPNLRARRYMQKA
jgi:hypothetical protein